MHDYKSLICQEWDFFGKINIPDVSITALTDSSGGSADDTIAAITNANNAGSADVTPTANAIADLAAKVNKLLGQQTGPWVKKVTAAAGAPSVLSVNGANNGELKMLLASTTEVENVCLYWGDDLSIDIDLIQRFSWRAKTVATLDSATSFAMGLAGARNDAIDSIAYAALFRCIANNTVVVETDDGVVDNDDKSTGGQTLVATYKWFTLDFSQGKSDVRFYMGNAAGNMQRVAQSVTFDMSGYSGCLQPFFQIQKTSDNNTDSLTLDYVRLEMKRG